VIEDGNNYRSKEQVLVDLAKALGFSASALQANREGKLTTEQIKQFSVRVLGPMVLTLVCALAPFLIWASMVSAQKGVSLFEGLTIFLSRFVHLSELVEVNGKFGAFLRMGSTIGGLVIAGLCASKVNLALYFDLLGREVVKKEGRVTAREEQTLRPNGRDPIENFFLTVGYDKYQVGLPAYRAIENGSMYMLYILPRSNVLVSMEPKINPGDVVADAPATPAAGSQAPDSSEHASSTSHA
jgi:hypothetical protein